MKKYLLIILFSFAITQGVYAQTTNQPQSSKELIPAPDVSGLVITRSEEPAVMTHVMNGKFNLKFTLHINGKDSTGLITITKNGKAFKTFNSKGREYSMALDLNSKYLFKCTKPGYITKTVLFDTTIPAGRDSEDFALFNCMVDLFKQDGKTKPYDKPAGIIKYNEKLRDFDY